jgi:hypothetical protein
MAKGVPKYPTGTPGAPGTPYAPSSRKKPSPTGLNPSSPSYGMNPGSETKDPIGRSSRITGTSQSRDLPSGQGNLESKARRSF